MTQDESFELESVGFGQMTFDGSGVPQTGYHASLGYTN